MTVSAALAGWLERRPQLWHEVFARGQPEIFGMSVLRGAMVTANCYPVGTVVCVRDPDMKRAWCLAASSTAATARGLTGHHASH